jgi:acetolactate synthase I/II/III large subunit
MDRRLSRETINREIVKCHRNSTVVVFNDGAYGNVRRNQEERFGNRIIASDLTNPDFVRFAESFGAVAERARNPAELRVALRRALSRREGPSLIEVPVGALPSPWEFIMLPRVRG